MNKQIEEHIATIEIANELCGKPCDICKMYGKDCMPCINAKKLAEKGYRKQSEGEWKWISDDDCICSACGKVFYTADNADAGTRIWKYCPKCGAKMKGGAE